MKVAGHNIQLVVIGGSAGSLPVLVQLLKSLNKNFDLPVIIVIHRQRHGVSELTKILSSATGLTNITEPDDKEPIKPSSVYLAPQNYHLLIESDNTFSLDYSEAVKYSRPSIDVTFESAATVYKNALLAILLSGANSDGTSGLEKVIELGGKAIVQEPETAQYPAMPRSAIAAVKDIQVMNTEQLTNYLNELI